MKSNYQPRVAKLLSVCQFNYTYLQQLLHLLDEQRTSIEFDEIRLNLNTQDNSTYTETFELNMSWTKVSFLPDLSMTIRLYHDARLAEVLTYQQVSRLLAVYKYPNDNMHQPDEKYRVNAFLQHVLKSCLELVVKNPPPLREPKC